MKIMEHKLRVMLEKWKNTLHHIEGNIYDKDLAPHSQTFELEWKTIKKCHEDVKTILNEKVEDVTDKKHYEEESRESLSEHIEQALGEFEDNISEASTEQDYLTVFSFYSGVFCALLSQCHPHVKDVYLERKTTTRDANQG